VDRFLKGKEARPKAAKGGALWALPFCLFMALCGRARADNDTLGSAPAVASPFVGSLDAGARLLYTQPAVLDSLAASAGFPKTGGLWLMWGGGATLTPGALRTQVSAWKGSLGATSGGASTQWNLGLAALTMEQAYPVSNFIFTAGASLEAGELDGSFIRGNELTGVESTLFGYSLQGGVRWPAQTMLSFFLRAGWEVLSGPGTWHGSFGSALGSSLFELGGPTATLQLELSL
jgi:hypothetical protein